jgi:hypothetical protein
MTGLITQQFGSSGVSRKRENRVRQLLQQIDGFQTFLKTLKRLVELPFSTLAMLFKRLNGISQIVGRYYFF